MRLLVGKDTWTESFFCFKLRCKGATDRFVIHNIAKAAADMGHRKIALKTDGELAMIHF